MPRAIGANCRLLTIPEVTYGTAPGSNWRRMPFLSCDLGAEQPLLDADVIGVGSNRDPAAPFLDIVTVQGQAVVPVDLVNIGHWLRLLLGPPTTTGTDPNFIHTYGSGAAALPSNSIEIGYPDVPSYDVCTGVRADTLEIDFSPSGPATASFGLMGQGSVRSGTSSGGTPTTAAYTAFHKAQGAISRGGSPLGQVTGARMTYANGMEMVRTIRADRKVEGVDPGIARATGQVTVRFADTTLLTQGRHARPGSRHGPWPRLRLPGQGPRSPCCHRLGRRWRCVGCAAAALTGGRRAPDGSRRHRSGLLESRHRARRRRAHRGKRLRARAAWHFGQGPDYCRGCAALDRDCGHLCPYAAHAPATIEGATAWTAGTACTVATMGGATLDMAGELATARELGASG